MVKAKTQIVIVFAKIIDSKLKMFKGIIIYFHVSVLGFLEVYDY